LLVALPFGLAAFAVLPAPSAQPADTVAGETPLSQVGSRLRLSDLDCSHLVHTIYESVGLHYGYATSRVLYRGTTDFRRVLRPNPGDLVAWRGHVGIVVDPSQHIFLSVLKTGVKTSSYVSDYWKHRGRARFLRYAPRSEDPVLSARVEDTALVALAAASLQ
jgi:cell wall-associated NlpC family hydrolase